MHIVLLVPGIRDYALWSNEISACLRRYSLTPQPLNYGRFDLFRFLLPLPLFRKLALAEVRQQLDIVRERHPEARISIIAHSFGTWLVAHMLAEGFNLKLHRIIFCGSVVPYNFRFELYAKSFTEDILNEVGDRDVWPALAQERHVGIWRQRNLRFPSASRTGSLASGRRPRVLSQVGLLGEVLGPVSHGRSCR